MKNIDEKKCKGEKKVVVKYKIVFEDYKKCLLEGKEIYKSMNIIRSSQHDVYSEQVNKIALLCEEDKIHTLSQDRNLTERRVWSEQQASTVHDLIVLLQIQTISE